MAGYQTEIMKDEFFKLSDEPDENGYKYYIIPVETRLYRGDTQMYIENKRHNNQEVILPNKPLYFAKEFGVAEKYGVVYQFVVEKEYRLLAIDDKETISKLYEDLSGNERIRNILRDNYGVKSGIRYTDMTDDLQFANYLCDNHYSGYAANQMPTDGKDEEGNLIYIHRELMICDTSDIRFEKSHTEREDLNNLVSEHKARSIATNLRKSRTSKKLPREQYEKSQLYQSEESPFKRPGLLFGDDSHYSPQTNKSLFRFGTPNSSPTNKNLFGDDSPNSPPVNNNLFGVDSPPANRSLFNFDSPAPRNNNLFGFDSPAPVNNNLFGVDSPLPPSPPRTSNTVGKRLSFAGKRATKKVSKKNKRKTMKNKKRSVRKH